MKIKKFLLFPLSFITIAVIGLSFVLLSIYAALLYGKSEVKIRIHKLRKCLNSMRNGD
jgi:hypothetical protein